MNLRGRIVDAGFWAGWNLLWFLPERFTAKLFDAAGVIAWRKRGKGIRQLELNLSRVTGIPATSDQIRILSKKTMRSYMRYYNETFALPRWNITKINQKIRTVNEDQVLTATKSGGVILTLPHSGNWDLAGAWAANNFGSMFTVAERLRPEGVFQKFLKMRSDIGITLMPLTGESGIYEFLKQAVLDGKVVALLGDRDVAGTGMTNDFFGAKATLPIGAAVLAIDTNAPLFTCATWYDGYQMVIDFDGPIEYAKEQVTGRERIRKAQEISGLIAKRFEKHIAAHPENWHMLQKIWPDLEATE